MAVSVKFYTYSKKHNSTAVPTTAAVTFNMYLKEPTSAINPTLVVAARDLPVPTAAPTIYNYAYIADFQRYYFVSDWVYNAGVWEVSLSVDVLGSNKTAIGSISCYVERAASTSNGTLIDNLYPTKTNFEIISTSVACSYYGVAPSGGSYVIGCINAQAPNLQGVNSVGAITYYACTQANINSLLDFLFGNSIYTASSITEMGQGLYESFFNPFQYIVSCIWFPFSSQAFGTNSTTIHVGYWDTGVTAVLVDNLAEKTYVTATIPYHPQRSARGTFVDHAPFKKITLYLPPFGNIPIDTRFMEIGRYLYCGVYVDHITGLATIRVNIAPSSTNLVENRFITERTEMLGVPIQLAQVMNEYSKSPTGLISDVLAEGLLSVIGSSVGSSINCSTPSVTTAGANGSFINFIMPPALITEHAILADDDNTNFGRPLMTVKTINTLSGYIKAVNPPVALPITDQETQMIIKFMEDGFYYE